MTFRGGYEPAPLPRVYGGRCERHHVPIEAWSSVCFACHLERMADAGHLGYARRLAVYLDEHGGTA